MRIIRISLPWILLLFFTCIRAGAQEAPLHDELFVEGGGSFLNGGAGQLPIGCILEIQCPSAGTSSFSKTGRIAAGARYRLRHDAIEASYSYSPNLFSIRGGTESFGSAYNRVDLVSFNYVRYISIRTRLQPFVTAGIGMNRFSGPKTASPVVSAVSILGGADNGWQFAWNYGGGADVVLQRHLALRLELRDYVTGQPSFFTGTSHNIAPSVGIVFRFK